MSGPKRPLRCQHHPRGFKYLCERSETYECGPRSVAELYDWPRLPAARSSSDEVDRIQKLFGRRMNFRSEYSGMCSEQEAVMRPLDSFSHGEFLKARVVFKCACGSVGHAQRLACQLSQYVFGGKMCVHRRVEDYLTSAGLTLLHGPVARLTEAAVAEDFKLAYATALDYLLESEGVIDPTQKVPCLVHGSCPMLGLPDSGSSDDEESVNCVFGGVTCNAWSRQSQSRARFSHSSESSHNAFIAKRRRLAMKNKEDFVFVECVDGYEVLEKFMKPLTPTHHCVYLPVNPLDRGDPGSRPRCMAAAVNREGWMPAGLTSVDSYMESYSAKYHRSRCLSGTAYLLATDEERNIEMVAMAADQTNWTCSATMANMNFEEAISVCMPPNMVVRYHDYMENFAERSSMGGDFLFDLDQNASSTSPGQERWPPMLAHGHIVGVSGGQPRLAVPLEHIAALGWHLFPKSCTVHKEANAAAVFKRMKRAELKAFAGRGVNLGCLATFMFQVFGNFVRKPKCTLQHPLQSCDSDGEEGDIAF